MEILDIMDMGKPFIMGAMAVLGLLFYSIKKKIADKILEDILNNTKTIFKKSHILNKSQILKDKKVAELLIELRTITHGDRASVYQFHNGNTFSNRAAIFKLSCTHETVSAGVSPELSKCQGILSSSILNIISCLWEGKANENGAMKLEDDTYVIRVESMDEGFCKAFFVDQGVKFFVYHPLIIKDNKIGMVGVAYCMDVDVNEIKKHTTDLSKYATLISYTMV